MNFKKYLSFTLLLITLQTSFAQEDSLHWLENSYDFGIVNEEGKQVIHRFYFVNKGEKAVKINSPRPNRALS